MRSALWGIVVASSTLTGFLWLGSGCGLLPLDCKELFNCPPGAGGSGATTTSSSTSTGSGGDSGPPATCIPAAGKDPIADTCGVFVSSTLGDDAAAVGTKKKPFKTLTAAIAAAAKASQPVYACAETFSEALTVSDGVGLYLYGGLDCKGSWGYAGAAKSTLTTDLEGVPLTLNKAAGSVSVFDFKVVALDAVIAGGSSIAVIADQVTASFTRCDLVAGNGMAGAPGVTSMDSVGPLSSLDSTVRGNDGINACKSATKTDGGLPKDNALCPSAMGGPLGGLGGEGLLTTGFDGAASQATAQTALGGKGQLALDVTLSCITGTGSPGAVGATGVDGSGAAGPTALGTITASGYLGVAGGDGDPGKPGQGGGGGGGAKGKAACAGASGGSGGAGGCGGHGGTGGTAGGASIGIIQLGATLAFDTVTIQLGSGGNGGQGAFGQGGGLGGKGGTAGVGDQTAPATSGGCDGGNGGVGGAGGHGGGGRGGHVIGIAASGATAPSVKGVTFAPKGKAGSGGKGGTSQGGDPGVQADTLAFP